MLPTPPRTYLLLLVLGVVGLGAYQVTMQRRAADAAQPADGILRMASFNPVATLNPHEVVSALAVRVAQALWEGLVELDPVTQRPRPAVAESWEISPDGLTAVFHLRRQARWSNGDPVRADDFVYAVRYGLRASAPLNDALLILRNARRLRAGELADPTQLGIRAVDDHTLELRLEQPVPSLLLELCDIDWVPFHPTTYSVLASQEYWRRPERLVTNGAFRLDAASAEGLRLRPNVHYRDREAVALQGVDILYTESDSLYPLLFEAGMIRLSDRLTGGELALPAALPDVELCADPTLLSAVVHFNTSRGVLADARIRRALSLALDRGAAASAVSRLDVRPSTTCVPPVGNWGDDRTVEEDIAEARRLLVEAGYPGGRGFPVLHWPYRIGTNKAFSRLPELCAAQWRERLGIPVYTRLLDDDAYLARERERDFDLILATWFGAMPDAARLAQLLVDPSLLALSDWQDPELEALVGKTRALRGIELHDALVAAERRFLAGMPATPVFVYNRHTLKHRSVLGWYPDPVGLHPLKHLRLADASAP